MAEAFAQAKREELKRGRPELLVSRATKARPVMIGAQVGFAEAAAEFLTWCKDTEYRARPSTAERIRVSFSTATEFFGGTPVRSLDSEGIEAYKAHRLGVHGVREITVRHDLHALSLFFQRARKLGWTKADPLDGVTIPSDRDAIREHVVTLEEEAKYFAAATELHARYAKSFKSAQPNLADLARLMLEQGCRPEEILAARQEHVGAGTLRIAGGKSRAARRTLNLTAASVEILARRCALPAPWLFPSERNPGHHMTKLDGTHDRVCREAGVSFVLYDFRHTFATRAIEGGVPVAVVAAILGHSGLRTIHRYVHPSADAQKLGMCTYEAVMQQRKLKVG
jgi:integrase